MREASFLAAAVTESGLPPPAFVEIAFAGRSNVGKSSLINTLLSRRRLVRTSSTPGATRGLALFRAELTLVRGQGRAPDRATLDLVDLPGYGYAQRSKAERRSWGPMIEGYLENRVGLRAVVLIIDIRRGIEDDDLQLLEFLEHVKRPAILVATKLDKLPSTQRMTHVKALSARAGRPVVGASSETGEGRDALWARIATLSHLVVDPPAA